MAAKDILSQDEIDALLHGVDNGSVEQDAGLPVLDGEVRDYDFTTQERIVRGRLPTLEMINQRFVRYFRISLFNMLRRSADISIEGTKMVKFSEYIQSLYVPTSLTLVKVSPLRGTALFMLDPTLVFSVVDLFFGGGGRFHTKIEGREFTNTELRVIQIVLENAFKDMKEAWQSVMEVDYEFLSHEVNPHLANIVSPNEVVVVSSFKVELESGSGAFHVTLPYSMVEPIRALLDAGVQSDRSDMDERFNAALREEIMYAKVNLSCSLTETKLTLRDLANIRAGDIIPIELPEQVSLMVDEIPVLRGRYGASRGQMAVKVDAIVRPEVTNETNDANEIDRPRSVS
jgi:flagellar motor switch protein FliM